MLLTGVGIYLNRHAAAVAHLAPLNFSCLFKKGEREDELREKKKSGLKSNSDKEEGEHEEEEEELKDEIILTVITAVAPILWLLHFIILHIFLLI